MKKLMILLTLLLNIYLFTDSSAQTMPLVYNVENSGANFPIPYLPTLGQLTSIPSLPDPFEWVDGRGRMSNYSDWEGRRNEIGAQIQNYEIGTKPAVDPSQISASYSGGDTAGSSGTLTVHVTVNGHTLTLTCPVSIPSGATAPYPAMIGMDSPYGALVASDFTSRGIVGITFSESQVSTYGSPNNSNPYYQLYPYLNVDNTGQYSGWAWGVSRVIDGLELVQNVLPIDLKHIGVTGCSYAGKLALFAGALDERIALTIAQESGGGGATSWRYSHSLPAGSVEDIDNTDYNWFMNSMIQFAGNNVSYLPEDHHELMAMVAPRALYVTANPDYIWLSNPSSYVASEACQTVYNALGIADRFGFSVVGGHSHCQVPSSQEPEIGAFVDKFLLGKDTVNTTNIADNPYTGSSSIDLSPWITWTNPILSNDTTYFATLAYPSNGQRGADTAITLKWNKQNNAEKYLFQLSPDPTFAINVINDSTTTDTVETVNGLSEGKPYYWRVQVKSAAGLGPWSTIWQFITTIPLPAMPQLASVTPLNPSQPDTIILKWNQAQYANQYIIEMAYTSSFSSLFYKDSTSDTSMTVAGISAGMQYYWRVQAENVTGRSSWSDSNFTLTDVKDVKAGIPTEYSISQNYPNPFNPTSRIEFGVPRKSQTKIIVYDLLGREIQTLVNEELEAGYYEINVDASNLPSGVYFYRIRSGNFVQTRKMILLK